MTRAHGLSPESTLTHTPDKCAEVARLAATLRSWVAALVFPDEVKFSWSVLHAFAEVLRETSLPAQYPQFHWFATAMAVSGAGQTEDELHDVLYEIDQRLNLDEEFTECVMMDRCATLFAMVLSFAGRFLSASLDPNFHREEPTEAVLRGKLEMAIQMAERSASGPPPPLGRRP